jgi:excisionase family DNA binding protein
MPEDRHDPDEWMRLSEAADYLGVHFTTLRRWADEGSVPCMRTPGNRRRFQKADLDQFLHGAQKDSTSLDSAQKLPKDTEIVHHVRHMGFQEHPWYSKVDPEHRTQMSSYGRKLIATMMQYSGHEKGGEVFLEEGKRLAQQYGEICQETGFSMMETVQAFLSIRHAIMDPLYEAGMLSASQNKDTCEVLKRVNHFLDGVLLSILEIFQDSSQNLISSRSK